MTGENQSIVTLSLLAHTWFVDLDGTLVKHNGYLSDGYDTLLNGAKEFINSIPDGDMIVITTSRTNEFSEQTKRFLAENGIRYNHIIFDVPLGERIVINDCKPSGLPTALALNVVRDKEINVRLIIDDKL